MKKHRSYTVDEAARTLNVTKGTVRRWMKDGDLPALTDQRPTLILGHDLIAFLDGRRRDRKTCQLHQAYCFRCRAPGDPAYGEVEIKLDTNGAGMMEALCATCTTVMHKRVSASRLPELQAKVKVTIKQAPARIGESAQPCPIGHFKKAR
ncbi:helix-turn-helix domain-containing protein [Amorphus coralli]|uniref:helix-turn-helix domain-containing protein n=1 Tax=Amorphus coralli TaxID=340680 RepID=UPI000374457E|nr:helix-turn-helix domain-containing protein [Amorphus coralli]